MMDTEPESKPTQDSVKKQPELPELNFKNVFGDIITGIKALVFDTEVNRVIVPILLCLTSIITKVVVTTIPYREVDFTSYMQQIQLINDGEIDYSQIYGNTGPIEFPAGFVQIFQFLSYLTNNGKEILTAQVVFGYLLTFTNLLILLTYTFTDRISPWPLYLLLASKQLISVYVLNLSNDCFTTVAMVGVTVFLQQASYWHKASSLASFLLVLIASDLFSVAISIQVDALSYLPGFLIVSYFLVEENGLKFLVVLIIIPIIQILTGWRFLLPLFDDEDAQMIRWNYIHQAFKVQKKYVYELSVNWKFIPENIFTSDNLATTLLIGYLSVVLIFIFTRYLNLRVIGKPVNQLLIDSFIPKSTIFPNNLFISHQLGPQIILLVLSTSNVIGVLFSRSLQYQSLTWYSWQLPFLLHSTGWGVIISGAIWVAHELCWYVYPATPLSSSVLVGLLTIVLIGVWNNKAIWSEIKAEVSEGDGNL